MVVNSLFVKELLVLQRIGTVIYNNVSTGLIPPERINVESVSGQDAKTGLLVFTKDQNIKIGDFSSVEYSIRCEDKDSHDGGHSSVISWIPHFAITGLIVTLRNKTGHFHSSGLC